jgi:hypothetical protein
MPDNQQMNAAVLERLKLKQAQLAKTPPEYQQRYYSTIFDTYMKPQYAHLKLKDTDLEAAKTQWIQQARSGKPQPLPSDFGVDKKTPSDSKKQLAGLESAGAGVAGIARNVLDFEGNLVGETKEERYKDPIYRAIADVERKAYDDAMAIDEPTAKRGAGWGHAIANQTLMEAGGVAGGASKIVRSVTGGLAVSAGGGDASKGKVAFDVAVNMALDALFHGLGKYGAQKAKTVIGEFKTSKNPAVIEAVKQVEAVGKQVADSNFGGKPTSAMSPEEYHAWYEQSIAADKAARVKANEAAKEVKAAAKAQEPSKEEKILAKAAEALKKKNASKAADEASKAFQKRVSTYTKRTGKMPEGEHLEALKGSATVDSLLGAQEKKVAKTITQVTNEHESKVLQEGAPQALEAVQALQEIAPKTEKVAKSKTEPMFKTDLTPLVDANSPEEFARAKKELKIVAQGKAKELIKSQEHDSVKVLEELRKEQKRIDGVKLPTDFNKKTLNALAKREEKGGQVGMDVAEAEKGQKTVTIGLHAEEQMADPRSQILSALDNQKSLLATIEGMVSPDAFKRVKKSIATDIIDVQNEKLTEFIRLFQEKMAAKQ